MVSTGDGATGIPWLPRQSPGYAHTCRTFGNPPPERSRPHRNNRPSRSYVVHRLLAATSARI